MKYYYAILVCLFSFQMVKGQCPSGNINLDSQSKVDNFIITYPSCTALPGDLRVAGNVTNLNGLQNITTIGRNFAIEESALASLTGLSNLKTVNGEFRMQDNASLTSLNGLQGLTKVGGSLMMIFTNVASLSGLQNLTSIGRLDLYFTNITNFTGLENLTSCNSFNITYNSLLTSLTGLENVLSTNPYVYIAENQLLSDCAIRYVCESSLPTPGIIGSTIRDNAPGCQSKPEVLDICIQEGILPVTLKSFQAKRLENDVQVIWNTTSEKDSKSFEIQRSSNGLNWVEIGAVMANGNSEKEIIYTFTDQSPLKGQNFYRLKMVDLGGTFAYSRIVNVNIAGQDLVDPFPNPVTDKLNLRADLKKLSSIEISNVAGKRFYMSDSAEQEINVKQFPSGVYMLKVNDQNGRAQIFKFVKQ